MTNKLQDIWQEVRWAYQRVFRGWDDRAVWNLDTYLADIVVPVITLMKSEKCGLMYDHSYTGDKPLEEGYHTDESQEVLFDKILFAFESHQDDFAHQEKLYGKTLSTKDNEWEEYNQKVKEGMTLFAEYYGGLWT